MRLISETGDVFRDYAGHYQERQGHFRSHPWTLRRSQRDLLARIKVASDKTLAECVERIGYDFQTCADPIFCDYITESFIRRQRLEREICLPCLRGENIRNWTATWHGNRKHQQAYVIALHGRDGSRLSDDQMAKYPNALRFLQRYRRHLDERRIHSSSMAEMGIRWYELTQATFRMGVPKIVFASVVTHGHFWLDSTGMFILKHPAQDMYLCQDAELPGPHLEGVLNSSVVNFIVSRSASRLQNKYMEFVEKSLARVPMLSSDTQAWENVSIGADQVKQLVRGMQGCSAFNVIRQAKFESLQRLRSLVGEASRQRAAALRLLPGAQQQLDRAVALLYAISDEDAVAELISEPYRRPWTYPRFEDDFLFESLDYISDLIEEQFAAQRAGQERPLAPAEIAAVLASNPKFEPLRAVYYGGKPVGAEQFVRECMDWDCRPIPFDQESVLVGRKPKRVDVLHERFFRFDSVNRNSYGWTGWSAEAQASVFLTLAERAPDKAPYYRWVARLIDLPEESPDISDPDVRAGLREIIGDAKPWPYVVME